MSVFANHVHVAGLHRGKPASILVFQLLLNFFGIGILGVDASEEDKECLRPEPDETRWQMVQKLEDLDAKYKANDLLDKIKCVNGDETPTLTCDSSKPEAKWQTGCAEKKLLPPAPTENTKWIWVDKPLESNVVVSRAAVEKAIKCKDGGYQGGKPRLMILDGNWLVAGGCEEECLAPFRDDRRFHWPVLLDMKGFLTRAQIEQITCVNKGEEPRWECPENADEHTVERHWVTKGCNDQVCLAPATQDEVFWTWDENMKSKAGTKVPVGELKDAKCKGEGTPKFECLDVAGQATWVDQGGCEKKCKIPNEGDDWELKDKQAPQATVPAEEITSKIQCKKDANEGGIPRTKAKCNDQGVWDIEVDGCKPCQLTEASKWLAEKFHMELKDPNDKRTIKTKEEGGTDLHQLVRMKEDLTDDTVELPSPGWTVA